MPTHYFNFSNWVKLAFVASRSLCKPERIANDLATNLCLTHVQIKHKASRSQTELNCIELRNDALSSVQLVFATAELATESENVMCLCTHTHSTYDCSDDGVSHMDITSSALNLKIFGGTIRMYTGWLDGNINCTS